jgi:hypothetical protein
MKDLIPDRTEEKDAISGNEWTVIEVVFSLAIVPAICILKYVYSLFH